MYLKRVELQGFKSFADKSVIEFEPGVTGIVGPNGCGKSNITDAIRWVLGEKSAKAMRGDTMTDVIFSGSEDRKPLNMAEVTLVFDNEDHYLDNDSNEVEITRRIYRDGGDAEYYINRQQCRLKDITDLVMDTGLGRDSLSIISQNSINAFVQSKPEERRGMFEEAAGVARYKQRKKESVAKLERTTTNLERVEDIVNELERQLNPLKRQKEKAETYLSLKDQLQEIEVSVLVKEIQKFTEELKTVDQELKKFDSDKVQNEAQMTLNEGKKEELEAKMYQLDQEVNDLQGKLLAAMNRVNDLEMQKVEIDANRKHILESTNKEDLEAKIANMKAMLQDALSEYNDRVERYNETKKEKEELDERTRQCDIASNNQRNKIENINISLHQLRATRAQIKDQLENKSGLSYGVRTILKAADTLAGIRGVVSDLIVPNEGYEKAVGVSLGGSAQFIVTVSEHDAKNGISYLKRNKAGRATFLPLDVIKGRTIRSDLAMIATSSEGYLGVMSDFVTYDKDIEQIVLNLLGQIVVTDTLDHATRLSKNIHHRLKVVTLEGDVVNVGGSLTGGSLKNTNNTFTHKGELERIEKRIGEEENNLRNARMELARLENEGREIHQMFLQKQVSFAKLEVVVTNKMNDLQVAKSEYEALTHQSANLEELEADPSDNKLLDELNEAKRERDALKEEIQYKRDMRMRYVNENDMLSSELRELRATQRVIEKGITDHRIAKTKYETDIQNALNRLNESYQMTYDHALEFLNEDVDLDQAKETVRSLRMRIASLGNVNLDAIQEYEDVSSRYETLNKNRIELREAQDALMKAISDMDQIMVERFSDTFEKINTEFNRVFRYLFGGGYAQLKYTDPDNILETGIDIEAQPPGKAAKLHSFSGGENALIALSCLFAMMSVRTVPLSILDEVEAALDPANVERFAKYLQEYSDKTQFIVVTHREGTMAQCDLLYGATMQQKGVTKLVSVKFEDATQMASA
ncbi:MAG TPA: ATPase [Erysipelotrichaceae bacterium]|nr:ATPase [Erysipelotrichaceae bacterium]